MAPRPDELTRFRVLSCVIPYLSSRQQAQLRIVNKHIRDHVVPADIPTPSYHWVLKEALSRVHTHKSVTLESDNYKLAVSIGSDGKLRMRLVYPTYAAAALLVTCKPGERALRVLYRGLSRQRVPAGFDCTAEEALTRFAQDIAESYLMINIKESRAN